ncbi:MAG: RagB/SusD family nutrient uptake outer membrane protein, partial [Bacteroidales bacterium]
KCYFALINMYANHSTGKNRDDLGVPLLLENNINGKSSRATLGEVHDQIITDLKNALDYLPENVTNVTKMKACKNSAYAFLAKVYLYVNNIESALSYINKCSAENLILYNYNEYLRPLDEISDIFNKSTLPRNVHQDDEILWTGGTLSNFWWKKACYSDDLVALFDKDNDLRFYIWATKYDRSGVEFPAYRYVSMRPRSFSVTSPEIYLIRAECNARSGNIELAMNDVNTVRMHRYKTGTDYKLTAATQAQAIQAVKDERLREFAFTGQNWLDSRRYHSYGESIPTYARTVEGGETVTLHPDSKRYTCAIPRFVLDKNPNIIQNER